MNNSISIEEKRKILKKNGWYQYYNEDNWLREGKTYTKPEWAGISTDNAFKIYLNEIEERENIKIIYK